MTYGGHARAIAVLGLPLVGGHLAQFAIGLTDTVMLGWYGVEELAAVTLAGSYFFILFMLGGGLAIAIMPLVAASDAQGDDTSIRRVTRMGLWQTQLYGVLAMGLLWWSEPILLALGQKPDVASLAAEYLRVAGWGIFPALWVMVLKSYLAGLERTQIVLWITILAAVVNAMGNYALIFGNWGAPQLGIQGAGIASVVTQVVSLIAVVIYALRVLPEHALFQRFWRPDWEMFGRVFKIGLPIGLTNLSEVSMFGASAFMMGWIGTVPLAAHGIAVQLAAATFMVHLGLSNAATIRAGNAFGRQDRAHMARGAVVVTAISLAVSAVSVVIFLTCSDWLISLFLKDGEDNREEILAIGVGLLGMAALFQLVDGIQAIALGVLRGVQDTAVPMVMAALSYWVVGIPASYVFGFIFGWQGIGVWMGLVLGLGCAAVLLMARFWGRSIKQIGTDGVPAE
ncbi:MATE family efflux transporter [Phaeobacter gallaeciensis]|uniref:Multidrug-efflux transporter n=2 Tax=Roseobacteraceae TaxID=2854170 RepID=A0A366WZR2_9RHOB|nr:MULTISPECIES: MATE family efflux transporter [Roseobacteraceae]MBT3143631.1 MATE family efflux transporter [Falsiruegeria litorea]MBT8167901.1 MATE family efflux transporter [Falsiruegeria litorea]RBW55436.1 MATE family efflux transporter [Phaeobacter gallaeciensis]